MSAAAGIEAPERIVDLVIEAPAWDDALPDLPAIAEAAAEAALLAAGQATIGQEIAVLACDDTRIASLNANFRSKPAATNVLSWPAHP
ncbi:MAG: rRNA maturation RNAse YbeY, partial [Pseudomonadota bacterium]